MTDKKTSESILALCIWFVILFIIIACIMGYGVVPLGDWTLIGVISISLITLLAMGGIIGIIILIYFLINK